MAVAPNDHLELFLDLLMDSGVCSLEVLHLLKIHPSRFGVQIGPDAAR